MEFLPMCDIVRATGVCKTWRQTLLVKAKLFKRILLQSAKNFNVAQIPKAIRIQLESYELWARAFGLHYIMNESASTWPNRNRGDWTLQAKSGVNDCFFDPTSSLVLIIMKETGTVAIVDIPAMSQSDIKYFKKTKIKITGMMQLLGKIVVQSFDHWIVDWDADIIILLQGYGRIMIYQISDLKRGVSRFALRYSENKQSTKCFLIDDFAIKSKNPYVAYKACQTEYKTNPSFPCFVVVCYKDGSLRVFDPSRAECVLDFPPPIKEVPLAEQPSNYHFEVRERFVLRTYKHRDVWIHNLRSGRGCKVVHIPKTHRFSLSNSAKIQLAMERNRLYVPHFVHKELPVVDYQIPGLKRQLSDKFYVEKLAEMHRPHAKGRPHPVGAILIRTLFDDPEPFHKDAIIVFSGIGEKGVSHDTSPQGCVDRELSKKIPKAKKGEKKGKVTVHEWMNVYNHVIDPATGFLIVIAKGDLSENYAEDIKKDEYGRVKSFGKSKRDQRYQNAIFLIDLNQDGFPITAVVQVPSNISQTMPLSSVKIKITPYLISLVSGDGREQCATLVPWTAPNSPKEIFTKSFSYIKEISYPDVLSTRYRIAICNSKGVQISNPFDPYDQGYGNLDLVLESNKDNKPIPKQKQKSKVFLEDMRKIAEFEEELRVLPYQEQLIKLRQRLKVTKSYQERKFIKRQLYINCIKSDQVNPRNQKFGGYGLI